MRDIRISLRALLATPVVTAVAALSLALGIGANTAIFSVVNGLFLRPLAVTDPGSLVSISSDFAIARGFKAGAGWSYPMWRRLHERLGLFGGGVAWSSAGLTLGQGGGQPVNTIFVDGDFFETLGVRARDGRTITTDDDVEGAKSGRIAVISHRFWQRQFGADVSAVGGSVVLGGTTFTIAGVTPPEFVGLVAGQSFDVALPLTAGPLVPGGPSLTSTRALLIIPVLRLKPGQSVESATTALRAIHADILGVTPDRLATVDPAFLREPFVLTPMPTGISDRGARGLFQRPLVVLSIVMALVLLVGSLNLANLALSRADGRRHEMGVRVALGAPRWHLARGVLVESALLTAASAVAGLFVAAWGSAALVRHLSNANAAFSLYLPFDWRVIGFTAAVGLLTTMLFGGIPAYRAARTTADLIRGQQAGTGRHGRFGGVPAALLAAQVAVSLVLVTGTGLFARTFQRLVDAPLGFAPDPVLVLEVNAGRTRVSAENRGELYNRVIERVAAVPGVAAAAASVMTPIGPGEQSALYDDASRVPQNAVTPGWFSVYDTRLLAGRDFDASDVASGPRVAIVNESYVKKHLAGQDPIGRPADGGRSSGPPPPGTPAIVGVVADMAFGSIRKGTRPLMYVPLAQSAFTRDVSAIRVSVRSAVAPSSLTKILDAAIARVESDLAFTTRKVSDDVNRSIASERSLASLASIFGALALLLAGLGVYGVTTAAVSKRRREMAIRMAVGMLPSEGVRLVMARVGAVVAGGIGVGIVAGLWLSRFIAALLYGLDPRDAVTFCGAALVLASAGLVAAWLPARRAAAVSPSELLRDS